MLARAEGAGDSEHGNIASAFDDNPRRVRHACQALNHIHAARARRRMLPRVVVRAGLERGGNRV